jgi:hypothetical protein
VKKLGGGFNFFKLERGALKNTERRERRGALKRFTSLKKTLETFKCITKQLNNK